MYKRFDLLTEIAYKINRESDAEIIFGLKELYDNGTCFIAFIGQFSAGKSCLINNLLERDILPSGVRETTPLLTYIKYGENEYARLVFGNEQEEIIPLEDVKILNQSKASKYNLSEVDHIEIYLQNELLKTGLVFLDTPGINTLIEKHQDLLNKSLMLSSNIVYVTGKALTNFDVEHISLIKSDGFNVSYVQTHCDNVLADEEDVSSFMVSDLTKLKDIGIEKNECYFVSNNRESSWNVNIDGLRNRMQMMAENLEEQIKYDISMRLNVLSNKYIVSLEEQLVHLEAQKNNDLKVLENKRLDIDSKIRGIQIDLKRKECEIITKVKNAQEILGPGVQKKVESLVSNSVQNIKCSKIEKNEEMALLLESEKRKVFRGVYNYIDTETESIIEDINGTIALDGYVFDTADIPYVESIPELVAVQNEEIIELRNKISNIDSQKEQILSQLNDEDYKELEISIKELQEEINNNRDAFEELGGYVPQFIEEEFDGMKPSDFGRKLGNVLDWATVFIPVPGPQVAKAGKCASVMKKAAKVIGVVEKTGKIVKGAKNVTDAVNGLRNMNKTYATVKRINKAKNLIAATNKGIQTVKKKAPDSILQYLTFEHWGEVIGKKFDPPTIRRVDEEYAAAYKKRYSELENERKKILEEEFSRKRELRLFKDEQEARKLKVQALEDLKLKIEKEIKQQEQILMLEAQERCLDNWRNECAEYFKATVQSNLKANLDIYVQELDSKTESYIQNCLSSRTEYLEKKKKELQDIASMEPTEVIETIKIYEGFIRNLRV